MRPVAVTAAVTVAITALSVWLLPGAPPLRTIILFAIIATAAVWIYRRSPFATSPGTPILATAIILLTVGVVANMHLFTDAPGASDSNPTLANPDAARNWNDALFYLGESAELSAASHSFYSAILAGIMFIAGKSLTTLLAFNVLLTTATLILTAATTWRLTASRKLATTAMCATACICYLMASGCILVKDAWMITTLALAAFAMSRPGHFAMWAALLAVAMSVAVRPSYALVIVAGLCITGVPRTSRALPQRLIVAVVAVTGWWLMQHSGNSPDIATQLTGAADFEQWRSPSQQGWYDITGDGIFHSPLQKLMFLPLSAVTQFLIPLPWTWARDAIYGPTVAVAHFGFPWYLFAATVIYYFAACRRLASRETLLLAAWGVLCWLIPCYTAMGTVSRYALPAIPLLAPAAAVALTQWRRRSFAIWVAVFAILLTATLITVHHLQTPQLP